METVDKINKAAPLIALIVLLVIFMLGYEFYAYKKSDVFGSATSYTISNLENGKTYYFSASAYDTSNNESAFSSEKSKLITAITTADFNADGIVNSVDFGCSSFTYSAWSACQPNNTQSRTVSGQSPLGCAGGNLILSQSCVYTSPSSGGGGGGGGGGGSIDSTPPAQPSSFSSQSADKQIILTWKNPSDIDFVRTAIFRATTTIPASIVYSSAPTPAISPQPFPQVSIFMLQVSGLFSIGMTSEQVKILQQMLASEPTIYPEGLITGYYGDLTIKAVQKFQAKYN